MLGVRNASPPSPSQRCVRALATAAESESESESEIREPLTNEPQAKCLDAGCLEIKAIMLGGDLSHLVR